MKSINNLLLSMVAALIVANSISFAGVQNWNDGSTYIINDDTYKNDTIQLGWGNDGYPTTQLEMSDEAQVSNINSSGTSIINMSNGNITGFFFIGGASKAVVTGGEMGSINVTGASTLKISGGEIWSSIIASDVSQVTISGGFIGWGIKASHDGVIYLDGTGFEVTDLEGNVTNLSIGDSLRGLGTFVDKEAGATDYYQGRIKGILADDSPIDCSFRLYKGGWIQDNPDIIIIPEPTSILLLLAGSIMIQNVCRKTNHR